MRVDGRGWEKEDAEGLGSRMHEDGDRKMCSI